MTIREAYDCPACGAPKSVTYRPAPYTPIRGIGIAFEQSHDGPLFTWQCRRCPFERDRPEADWR